MDTLINWLIARLNWVYEILVLKLGLPLPLVYVLHGAVFILFFYDLYDIYTQRNKGNSVLGWLAVLLLMPLGSIFYIVFGRNILHNLKVVQPKPKAVASTGKLASKPTANKAATTIGSIVAVIAIIAGISALVYFIIIVAAMIQCANDPKCM